MARRIIISVIVTMVLLVAARWLSKGKPVDYAVREAGMTLYHRTVPAQIGPGQPLIKMRVDPPLLLGIVVRWMEPPSKEIGARGLVRVEDNKYEVFLPDLGKGARIKYWITATNSEGTRVRVPKNPSKFGILAFKGPVSKRVLVAHIVCMFGAFFFMVMSLFGAVGILRAREGKRGTVRSARWVLVCSFIGFVPLGMLLNHEVYGTIWEGYPFGRDITDSKTQVIFVLWLVSLLLVRGSFIGGGEEKDRLGPTAFAWAIIVSFLVSLALFIVPHSI
ncbi:MAG TPA: hypothetical protein VII85_03060 [Candidatus Krumholzibacteriaceae bacterium]